MSCPQPVFPGVHNFSLDSISSTFSFGAMTEIQSFNAVKFARRERLRYGWQKEQAYRLKTRYGGEWESAISRVLNDNAKGISAWRVRIIRTAIARALKQSVAELFPEDQQAA